jgi:hypothetical protein
VQEIKKIKENNIFSKLNVDEIEDDLLIIPKKI